MFALDKLNNIQDQNKSMICLGLDPDPKRMPQEYSKSIKGMYEFLVKIIDSTKDIVSAYKPNMAFYENRGHDGFSLLESVLKKIPSDVPIILDGKRGDIGNTASFYAEAMFKQLNADWVTLNPYMGYDALRPFLEFKDKGIFVLCLTSNTGSKDFQLLDINGKPMYQIVAEKVDYWNKDDNCGLVIGATKPEQLKEIRKISGNMPLLIPGVGAQGGSLEKAAIYGTDNFKKTALINVSRSVLYASEGEDFAERAREELQKLNESVQKLKNGEINIDQLEQQQEENNETSTEEETEKITVTTETIQEVNSSGEDSEIDVEEPNEQSSAQDIEQVNNDNQIPVEENFEPASQEEKAPPPLPTPPEPLPPNPEVLQRNQEQRESNSQRQDNNDQNKKRRFGRFDKRR
jgi:orotidine-5'-phosphate decarboxylase